MVCHREKIYITNITTGPVPGDPIEKDTLRFDNWEGYSVFARTRRVLRLKRYPTPMYVPDALTVYSGIVKPEPKDIDFISTRRRGIQAVNSQGNLVDEPLLPYNALPTATFVTFLHFIPIPPPISPQLSNPLLPGEAYDIIILKIIPHSELPPYTETAARSDEDVLELLKRKMQEDEERNRKPEPVNHPTTPIRRVRPGNDFCLSLTLCGFAAIIMMVVYIFLLCFRALALAALTVLKTFLFFSLSFWNNLPLPHSLPPPSRYLCFTISSPSLPLFTSVLFAILYFS